jgi:hypothetical protein
MHRGVVDLVIVRVAIALARMGQDIRQVLSV